MRAVRGRRIFFGRPLASGAAGVLAVLVFWSGAAETAHQPALPLPGVLARIQQAQQAIRTIQFNFKERLLRPEFGAETISGRVAFRRPYLLRLDQKKPQAQRLISDGKRFWLYTPAAAQQLTGDWASWVKRSAFPEPLLSFVGDFPAEEWSPRYHIFFGGYDRNLYKIILRPKTAQEVPLDLWVSDETFLPVRGRFVTAPQTVDIFFSDLKINPELEKDLFEPRVPPGTASVPLSS